MTDSGSWRSRARKSAFLPVYPYALIAAFVINELMGQAVPAAGFTRPFLVLAGAILVIQLVLAKFAGRDPSAYLAAMVVIAAFDFRTAGYLFAFALVPLAVTSIRARRVAPLDWRRLTGVLNLVATVSLVLAISSGVGIVISLPSGTPLRAMATAPPGPLPDIYLILLDAYPRADTLETALAYDNSSFLESMAKLGFTTAAKAHSNYNRTTLTVPSFLNARQIDELMPYPPASITDQHRYISSFVNQAAAVGEARGRGYTFVDIPTDVEFLSPNAADVVLDSGELSKLEWQLQRNGFLGRILDEQRLDWFREEHRSRVFSSFAALQRLPTQHDVGPRLVFAHIMAPHNPIAFRKDGSIADVPECFWEACDIADPLPSRVRDAIVEQVEFVNDQVERTARQIIEQSAQPPVIIVFSDHGFRHWLSDGPETFRSLMLSYTPGQTDVFPDDSTPVNIIPRVLNAYAGAGLPLEPDDMWFTIPEGGDDTGYFPLTEWRSEPPP